MLECAECSKKESIDTKQKCFSSSRCLVCQNQLAFIPQLPLDVAHRLKKDTENPKENSSQKKHNTAMPGTSSVYRDLLKQFNMICKYYFYFRGIFFDLFIVKIIIRSSSLPLSFGSST